MRGYALIGAAAALVAGIGVLSIRLPAVEDALFERALAKRFSGHHADLFDDDGLKIFFCGTGSHSPSVKRAQSCIGVIFGDRIFLVDAGAGSWARVQAAGIPAERLGGVFLTQLSSDHIGDLGEANLGSWVAGRFAPLRVYGPAGVERVVNGFNEAYALDSDYRVRRLGEGVAPPHTAGLEARPFDGSAPYIVFAESGFIATAFPLKRESLSPAVGYSFYYKGRSVIVSGDASYTDEIAESATGVDVLIRDGIASHMIAKTAAEAKTAGNSNFVRLYGEFKEGKASPEDAARAANEAAADWLVLTHLAPAPDDAISRRIFMRGVSNLRAQNVKLAEDGLLIVLPEGGGVEFSKL